MNLDWPRDDSIEGVLSALRNEVRIGYLRCDFNDEHWDTSQELRDALIVVKNSSSSNTVLIQSIRVINNCRNEEKKKHCLDLFLGCLQRHSTEFFNYIDIKMPWTLSDAKKAASTIASITNPITILGLTGDFYSNKGTFECVFNAILDGGMVQHFRATGSSFFDLKHHGCIGKSNLSTNKTLKYLELRLWNDDVFAADEGIKQFANALKTNQGLENLLFSRGIMSNGGRIEILKSLRDNTSLLLLDTTVQTLLADDNNNSSDELLQLEGGIEGQELQTQINKHMRLNKFWKNLEDHRSTRPIPIEMYPDVVEVVAKKPLLLYKFLRERDHTPLFGSFYKIRASTHHIDRRRSARVLKKRRFTAPGNSY